MMSTIASGCRSVIKSVSSVFSTSKVEEIKPTTNSADSHPFDLQPNNYNSEEPECSKRLADAVKEKSTKLKQETGPLSVYKIPLIEESINVEGCKRFSFGKESTKGNRTIMVLGATGAGKSTLINGMINYILGVEWEDQYRFKLFDEGQSKSQAESQTSEVTAYKINHQESFKVDYSLTIVDTPGFGDTRGIERDRMIVEQLRNLFSAKLGVSEIDAVCFVAQASLARLTPTQKYVFDSVLSIFGKDVAENIRVLVTFADGQRPPVLEAINASGVPCPKTKDGLPVHFKFNNSALFAQNKSSAAESMSEEDDEDGGFDQMFWNMGTKSMKRFFVALNVIETKSLTLTKEVLKERQQLEISVEGLQKQVKLGLAKVEEIKETAEQLKEHEAEISRNENFEFYVTITKPFQSDISGTGIYLTNCQQCHFTCHYKCAFANDADKIRCLAMTNGNCTQCPGKCVWSVHHNQKYKWEYKEVKEKTTVKELKEKYLEATEAKAPVQALIDKLKAEYNAVQAEVVALMKRSAECLNRLKEIALKPNPLSTPEYIDMLIEGEKSEAKPGWRKRVQALIDMREKAEYMAKVERGETLLQSPSTDFQCFNQGQTKNNDNQDKAVPSNDNTETYTNIDQDKTTSKADQDDNEADTDQDKTDTNIDQDKTDTNSETSQNQNRADPDPKEVQNRTNINADQDKTETDTNQEKIDPSNDKTETYTNIDQDKTTSKADQDDNEADTDQGKTNTNIDQDKTDTNSETSQNQNRADPDPKEVQNKTNINADQDKTETDTNQEKIDPSNDNTETYTNIDTSQ